MRDITGVIYTKVEFQSELTFESLTCQSLECFYSPGWKKRPTNVSQTQIMK